MGIIKYTTDKHELYWAKKQELSAQLTTITEFLHRDILDYISFKTPKKLETLRTKISKIQRWKKVYSVILVSYPFGKSQFSKDLLFTEPLEGFDLEKINVREVMSTLDSLESGKILISENIYIEDYKQGSIYLFLSAAKVLFNKKNTNVVLLVHSDVTAYQETSKVLLKHLFGVVIFIFFVGFLVTFVISFLITREIGFFHSKTLVGLHSNIDSSSYLNEKGKVRGIVREFNDLNNTFMTMMSIARNVLFRYRRNLITGERFRNSEDLIKVYFDKTPKNIHVRTNELDIHLQMIGSHRIELYFWDEFEIGNTRYLIFGSLHNIILQKNSFRKVDSVVISLAIIYYFKLFIIERNKTVADVLKEIWKSFSIQKLNLVEIKDKKVSHFLMDLEHGEKIFSNELLQNNEKYALVYTFSNKLGPVLHKLYEILPYTTTNILCEKLSKIFSEKESGIILILQLLKKENAIELGVIKNAKKKNKRI